MQSAKIPIWTISLIWSLISILVVGGMAWGAQRTDVGNLKERVSKLEFLPEAVAALGADLKTIRQEQTVMSQDVKTLLSRGH